MYSNIFLRNIIDIEVMFIIIILFFLEFPWLIEEVYRIIILQLSGGL